jgi:hypothetical protein
MKQRELEDYEDETYLHLEPRDPIVEQKENEARQKLRQRLEQRKQQQKNEKIEQLNVDRVLLEFAQSELDEEWKDLVNKACLEDSHFPLFEYFIPKQFSYVVDGHERAKLLQSSYKQFAADSKPAPKPMLQTLQKNVKNAIQALKDYENKRLSGAKSNGEADTTWFTEGNMMHLNITFVHWPQIHYVPNPEVLYVLSTPFYLVVTENLLILFKMHLQ